MPDRVQNSLLLRELFQRLDHTWEQLRLTDHDSPLVNDINRLREELLTTSDRLLDDDTDLITFERKCAEFGACLQEATIRHFIPAQFREQLDDLAAEFRLNDIRMEDRLDDIEQRLREAPDRPNNDDDVVSRLRRCVYQLRTEARELQEALHTQEDEIINLRATVAEIPILREDVRYLRHELDRLRHRRRDSPNRSSRRRERDDSPSPRRCREDNPPNRRRDSRDSRPRHRSDSAESHHHRHESHESREPRRRHRDDTPRPRRMIEFSPPPKFSGTDKKVLFTNWWWQVTQFLDSQPRGHWRRQAKDLLGLDPPRG
jgi:predicted  nucleic acid-binding Zn-ribbon protein